MSTQNYYFLGRFNEANVLFNCVLLNKPINALAEVGLSHKTVFLVGKLAILFRCRDYPKDFFKA